MPISKRAIIIINSHCFLCPCAITSIAVVDFMLSTAFFMCDMHSVALTQNNHVETSLGTKTGDNCLTKCEGSEPHWGFSQSTLKIQIETMVVLGYIVLYN